MWTLAKSGLETGGLLSRVRINKAVPRYSALATVLLVTVSTISCLRRTTQQTQPSNQSPRVEQSALPQPNGLINDYANVFDPEAKRRLDLLIEELRHDVDVEFAIVTVDTTHEQSIFDYSLALARYWKPGGKSGRGLLLLLAIKDRQWRLQVSRALENDLPNEVCARLAEPSVELYKQGKYAEGVDRYLRAIGDRLRARK